MSQVSQNLALPPELMTYAFSFLSPEDLARASGLCKDWRLLGSSEHLWQEFDLHKVCRVFDQEVWETHFDVGSVGVDASGAEPMNKRTVIPFLIRLSRQVEANAGVTLLTLPKGLTLNKLITLGAAPKQGEAVEFRYIWPCIIDDHGDVAVPKTQTLAITNFFLKESRDKTLSEQRALAQRHECHDLPSFLSMASLVFLTRLGKLKGRRYDNNLTSSFASCPEKASLGFPLIFGSMCPGLLHATGTLPDSHLDHGAGAMRDLSSSEKEEHLPRKSTCL